MGDRVDVESLGKDEGMERVTRAVGNQWSCPDHNMCCGGYCLRPTPTQGRGGVAQEAGSFGGPALLLCYCCLRKAGVSHKGRLTTRSEALSAELFKGHSNSKVTHTASGAAPCQTPKSPSNHMAQTNWQWGGFWGAVALFLESEVFVPQLTIAA